MEETNQENLSEVAKCEIGDSAEPAACDVSDSEAAQAEAAESNSASSNEAEAADLSELEKARAALDLEDLPAAVEAMLLAHGEPLSVERMSEVFALSMETLQEAVESISKKCQLASSGIELRCVGGQYQLRTKTQYAAFIKGLNHAKPRRLTGAALETLAIVAYRQPIVKSDIETIRGVDATPTIKTLLDRRLIKIVGHQSSVGQPALYGTSDDFLKIFGLKSLSDLPTLRDLKELDSDPGEETDMYDNNLREEVAPSDV
jgi:segregation and condensation protein B